MYEPYGLASIRTYDWFETTDSYDWLYRFQSGRYTPSTGLYHFRNRDYVAVLGTWGRRDPRQYIDSLNLFSAFRAAPIHLSDSLGHQATQPASDCNCCGPTMDDFLVKLINSAVNWVKGERRPWDIREAKDWLWQNGGLLDWWSTMGPYKVRDKNGNLICPSKSCQNTYWICGECVHDHWIGNFMFGFIAKLLGIPDLAADAAGQLVQDPLGLVADPPWDTAGYSLGRNMLDALKANKTNLCEIVKSDPKVWAAANDLTVQSKLPFKSFPVPHAANYGSCKECELPLPAVIENTVPGGKLGGAWPPIPRRPVRPWYSRWRNLW